jgi:hypothetical protein
MFIASPHGARCIWNIITMLLSFMGHTCPEHFLKKHLEMKED